MFRARSLARGLGVAGCLLLAATFSVSLVAALSPVSTVSWTWIGGDTGINNPGTYGTLNQTSAGSAPRSREYPAAWVGRSNTLYLFGGFSSGNPSASYLNDLWTFDLTSLEWTWIGGSSEADQPGVYGTVGTGSPNNIPGSRYGSAYWQTDDQHFWLFGGLGFDKTGNGVGDLNDMWQYDTETGIWTWFGGNDTFNAMPVYGPKDIYSQIYNPGGRDSAAFWLGADGLLWLFGGEALHQGSFSDLWSFNTTTFQWAYRDGSQAPNEPGNFSEPGVANATNAPGARRNAYTWTDLGGNLWLFGGIGYGNSSQAGPGLLNDLWVYNISQLTWIFIAGNTTIQNPGSYGTLGEFAPTNYPGGRDSGSSFVDSSGNLQLFGGGGNANDSVNFVFLNDLWVFDIELGQWAWINGSSTGNAAAVYGALNESDPSVAPGGRAGPAFWNTSGTDPVMFGGFGYSNTSGNGFLNDAFALRETFPTPTPRSTPTSTPTLTPTITPTATATPTPTPTPTPVCTIEICGSPGQYTNQDACEQVGCCFNSQTNACTLKSVSAACSAVPVTQRVPCGWSYIYPDECTAIPGCCWQPTANGILAPWCYYDIDHAPQASVALQEVQAPVPVCPSPGAQRQPCGNAGINQFTCYAQGCCYDSQAQNQWVQNGKQQSDFASNPYCFQPEKTCAVGEFERQPCTNAVNQNQQLNNNINNNQFVRLLNTLLYGEQHGTQRTSYSPQQCLEAGCCLGLGNECFQPVTEYVCQTYGYVSNSLSGMTGNVSNSSYIACGPECCNAETQNCTYNPFSNNNQQQQQQLQQQQQQQVLLPSFCVCKDPTKQCGTYLIPSDNLVNKVRCCRADEECINNQCVVISPTPTPSPVAVTATPSATVSAAVSATMSASASASVSGSASVSA